MKKRILGGRTISEFGDEQVAEQFAGADNERGRADLLRVKAKLVLEPQTHRRCRQVLANIMNNL